MSSEASTRGTSPDPADPSGPTRPAERALAPDLARGAMLLFIALANAHIFLVGTGTIRSYPTDGSLPDAITAGVLTMFVDGRAYTMFAALFGYGLVQIWHRRQRAGADWPATRQLLRRRARWLIVFGVLHAVLLFFGDILAAYGLLALVLVGALLWSDRRLLFWAGVMLVVGSLAYGFGSMPMAAENEVFLQEPNPLVAALFRGGIIVFMAPFAAFAAACSFLLGIWAARYRVLEEPERHRRLLQRTLVIGLPLAVAGGAPLATLTSGWVSDPSPGLAWAFGVLHTATGYLGGLAYAAAIALIVLRLRNPDGPVSRAVGAVGQRSMTCYLSQSVVWMVLFPPYTLGLGDRLGVAVTALISIGTWVLTVVLAEAMRRAGKRGPFEVLIRRLVYRPG